MTFGNKKSLLYKLTRVLSSLMFVPISYVDYVYPRSRGFARNEMSIFIFLKTAEMAYWVNL
tara:strand:+ start:1531 stop:1713 length:183 start_codon:yes stop_codon:yes gene_type:complete